MDDADPVADGEMVAAAVAAVTDALAQEQLPRPLFQLPGVSVCVGLFLLFIFSFPFSFLLLNHFSAGVYGRGAAAARPAPRRLPAVPAVLLAASCAVAACAQVHARPAHVFEEGCYPRARRRRPLPRNRPRQR